MLHITLTNPFLLLFPDDSGIRFLMNWQYRTINRGENSLLTKLSQEFPTVDLSQYITFNALRKAEYLITLNETVTEQIYVHSKLLIVDDKVALIGSANINDRSFMGDRDSEIAVVIEDASVNPYAAQLRRKLWCEHLGLRYPDQQDLVADPMSSQVWNDLWLATAKSNTEIFRYGGSYAQCRDNSHLVMVAKLLGKFSHWLLMTESPPCKTSKLRR